MKTTENTLNFNLNHLDPKQDQLNTVDAKTLARPFRSLRPMKSMERTQSFKPRRIELAISKKRTLKGF